MYSRSFFNDEKEMPTPPENYGGTALGEEKSEREGELPASIEAGFEECCRGCEPPRQEQRDCRCEGQRDRGETGTKCHPCEEKRERCTQNGSSDSGLFGGLFSGGLFREGGLYSLFRGGGIKSLFSNIGTEEILIIATALFLFLSKEGDKECAVMLLLLLMI